MLLSALFFVVCFACLTLVRSAFYPAALPLSVRSPYLQCYADTLAGDNTNDQWPQFWTESRILGWSGWIRIDGSTFQLWGQSGTTTNLTSFEVTPTRTVFSIHANTTNVNVTFLSPIEPSNLVLQSLPFSYVYIDVESNDGQEHSIQLYSDISAEWISGDSNSLAEWSTTRTDSSTIHKAARQTPLFMQEINSLAEDATVYYAFLISNDATYETGNDTVVRGDFIENGALFDSVDTKFRAISDHFVVFGHAINLSNITNTASSVVWAVGLVRDPVINLYSTSANNNRSSYFWTEYNTVSDAIDFFLSDFSNARQRAIDLDDKIVSDARQVSDNYADLVTLAARQALAVDITVSKDSEGQWNTSDVMTFMKDVGNSRRVNPVEILYAAFPVYLYFNTTWAEYLLEPLLQYQQSSQYTKTYAAPDLGSSYPSAEGNDGPSIFGAIEDSGNMLIMSWAHARFSGDSTLITRYYNLYKRWADYLVSVTLDPNGYTDADGLDNANMTNLAIKGIIGIKAMSEISQALGKSQDAETYSSTAKSYVEQWQISAGSTGHLLSTYGPTADSSSWSLVYNLFADKLLGTALVDSSIYTNQDTFYSHEADTSGVFGIQYDSSVANEAKSHWTMFAAGASNDTTVRDTLISLVHTKAGSNVSAGVFPLTYNPNNGSTISGQASPGQGAMFSLMALSLQNKTVGDGSSSNNDQTSSSGSSKAGAIAGGVVGGLAALTLLIFGFFMCRRRQRRTQDMYNQRSGWSSSTSDTPFCMGIFRKRKSPERESNNIDPILSESVIPQPYDPYGSYGTQHSLQPLRPGQQYASVESYAEAGQRLGKRGQPIILSSPTSDPTAAASTTAFGSSSASRSGGSDSDTTGQLRNEVENLRREMEEMRARSQYEPPPQYA
ncbi:uncharacterized protein BT62DRAFT_990443 [Guyanagaster necrorhizus]|uniref:DUF1793-domain-containing protein n=1 Tax=Guyanagaster necrorhizus TaxID=856835 RepID=A0A9P7W3U8_9AGAR|nr:uncharacterized protein BT62DRAFT_990443 [Guyanagaster necrorhizus MCA 3950]KAG7452128.1 hypothetical protein BT62DRAFT_990443 [Guyanagaster necrorhizus MCA 3950]